MRMAKTSLVMSVVASVAALVVAFLLVDGNAATVQVDGPRRIDVIRPPAPPPSGRLSFDDLEYQGGFRVPEESNGESFSYGGQQLAYNPIANTLFAGSLHQKVAEISIPSPGQASLAAQLPLASFVQPFSDPADGRLVDIADNGVVLGGLLVHDGRLYGTGFIYYDGSNSQRLSHYTRSLDLTRREVTRIHQVGETGKAGLVAGYMATVPQEWRAALGGAAVTGQCCIPIISRTSFGPALFAWNPADLGRRDPLPATPLLYYTQQRPTLGPWEGANQFFGATTEVAGVAIIGRTVLFAGRNGMGAYCYGEGTDNARAATERGPGGEKICYDPTSAAKGPHAFPYRLQFWAYDVSDLAAVRAGAKDPWDVRPYAVWPFELPAIGDPYPRLGAIAYDPARRRLFMTQLFGDQEGYSRRPIIHVYTVRQHENR